jgi:hypothetical protein
MDAWTPIAESLPPDGAEVMTKIDDANGCRNEQTLTWSGRLWFLPDMTMYVYATPTHWRPLLPSEKKGGE